MSDIDNLFRFNKIIVFYQSIKPLIERQQSLLQKALLNPRLSVGEGVKCFENSEQKIKDIIKKYQTIDFIFNLLPPEEKGLVVEYIFQNKPAFMIAQERGYPDRTFFRKWERIVNKVLRKYDRFKDLDYVPEVNYG